MPNLVLLIRLSHSAVLPATSQIDAIEGHTRELQGVIHANAGCLAGAHHQKEKELHQNLQAKIGQAFSSVAPSAVKDT